MDALRDLLACPICGRALAISWQCERCGVRYTAPDGIPNLRLGGDARTDAVRRFYERAPFPGYGDRKSTRLNSSHSQISYAVFCLKKKTQSFSPTPMLTDLMSCALCARIHSFEST